MITKSNNNRDTGNPASYLLSAVFLMTIGVLLAGCSGNESSHNANSFNTTINNPGYDDPYLRINQEVYSRGFLLEVWQNDRNILSDALQGIGSMGSMVVTKQPFSPGVIRDDKNLARYYNQDMFFVWNGYLNIEKEGNYTIVINYDTSRAFVGYESSLYIDNKKIKDTSTTRTRTRDATENTLSTSVSLTAGAHKIQIPLGFYSSGAFGAPKSAGNYSGLKFVVNIKEPGASNLRELTPYDLLHKKQ